MSTLPLPANIESNPKVKAVFDDIRQTRQSDFINNMWHYLAFDPELLESTWREVKAVMASPSSLDPLTKEMIYIAVSVTNACSYCVHSHTAAAKSKGMSDVQHANLLRVIALAGKTNQKRPHPFTTLRSKNGNFMVNRPQDCALGKGTGTCAWCIGKGPWIYR
jgi:AhpD family alkylhydroperoxidase